MTIPLDHQQTAASTSQARKVVCIAGPGSGKTRTLVSRVERCPRGSKIAIVTYTNVASEEIRDRLAHVGIVPDYCGTLHGLAIRILQRHAVTAGFPAEPTGEPIPLTVVSQKQAEQYLAAVAAELHWTGTALALDKAVQSLRAQKGPQKLGLPIGRAEMVARTFLRRLKAESLVTFDSLLSEALAVAHREGRFTHLFVDEYQDAGPVDHALYQAMDVEYRFFVGDPDQAIYGFRGGDFRHLVGLTHDPAWSVHVIESNYRSGSAICGAASRLIRHNQGRVTKVTVATRTETGKVTVKAFQTQAHEVSFAVLQLEDLTPENGADVAVLCRTNADVQQWSDALAGYGVPVARREVVDRPYDWQAAIAFVAYCGRPGNDTVARLFYGEQSTIDRQDVESARLNAAVEGVPLDRKLLNLQDRLTEGATLAELAARHLSRESARAIADAIQATDGTAQQVLVELNLRFGRGQTEAMSQGVTVTTIHGSKGREFRTVYLVGMDDATMPGRKTGDELEEERRLAFVAVTRAKDSLIVTWSRSRRGHNGMPVTVTGSRFIGEMEIE